LYYQYENRFDKNCVCNQFVANSTGRELAGICLHVRI